jgi:hypothetical protein
MAEKTMLVCDVCGAPAAQTVTIKAGPRTLWKDFCETHLAELLSGTRPPRRGRRPGSTSKKTTAATRRGRRSKGASAKAAPARRGRRRAAPAAAPPDAESA